MKILGRIPLPRQKGGAHGTKKGRKGYDRKREKALSKKRSATAGRLIRKTGRLFVFIKSISRFIRRIKR